MKIAIIHSAVQGFFPRFYKSLKTAIENNGDKCILLVPNSGVNRRNKLDNQKNWGTRINWFIHHFLYKLTGLQDIFSCIDTLSLLYILKKENPDIIHLHIINDQNINMPLLVNYINKNKIPVVWTMHDCRAFTGRCAYFDEISCNRWKYGCGQCPQKELYMPTWIDASHTEWLIRKKWHTKIEALNVITPSKWLENLVKQSFFNKKAIHTIYNGIDISTFSESYQVNVREIYNIKSSCKILLGIGACWEYRKGIFSFIELASKLSKEDFQIVIIGNISVEIKQILPKNILHIEHISDPKELAAWYQAAAIFINPTLADNFPTTNIEALASGTPVITFDTGGSPEAIDEYTGIIVSKGDNEELLKAIYTICNNPSHYSREKCRIRAQKFSNEQYKLYVDLYHSIKK